MSDEAEPNDDGVLKFFQTNVPSPGYADLFLLGDNRLERNAFFAAVLRMFRSEERPAFAKIVVVLPPGNDGPSSLAELKADFADGWRRCTGKALTPEGLEKAFSVVHCTVCETLEAAALDDIVRRGGRECAYIVAGAASYRTPDAATAAHGSALPEDFWVGHLLALTSLLKQSAQTSLAYVALDAGEVLPDRTENRDLLHGTPDGLLGVGREKPDGPELAQQFEQWRTTAQAGRVGPVLADIDRQKLPDRNKMLLKSQILQLVGALPTAKALLEADPGLVDGLEREAALRAAILAEQVDADAIAAALLAKSIVGLRDLEFLEAALQLGDRLDDRAAVTAAAGALSSLFPGSSSLRVHRAKALVRERRFREAADLFRQGDVQSRQAADFYALVAERTEGVDQIDVDGLIAELGLRFPNAKSDAAGIVAELLEARGKRSEAIHLLIPQDRAATDRGLLRRAFAMIERGRLVLDPTVDDDLVLHVLDAAITWLASHPLEGEIRLGLLRLLSPEILGSIAVPMMAKLLIDQAAAGVRIRWRAKVDDRPPPCAPEKLEPIMRIGLTALNARGGALLGKFVYPADLLTEPAEAVVLGFAVLIEHMGKRVLDDGDVRTIEASLMMACAIAPLGPEPDDDLVVMRLAAGRLAVGGRVQRARDMAEQALASGGGSPSRRRLSWFAFADTYARLGNSLESMIGMACAVAADDEATWDQIFYESLLLLRILRDIGLLSLARPLIAPARRALTEMGVAARYGDRIDTVELQLDFAEFDRKGGQPEQLNALIERSAANLRRVLASDDEAEPAVILLANIIRIAGRQGIEISSSADRVMKEALAIMGSGMGVLFDALGAADPSAAQVSALAARLEGARYRHDTGYDVAMLVVAARRLLASAGPRDAATAFYGVEILADQTITLPGQPGPSRSFDDARAPAEVAREISREGLSVVGIGNTDDGLVRVSATGGELDSSSLEPLQTFSEARLVAWQEAYPYGYRDVQAFNEFYISTDGIGVSELPERAVVIASSDLQGFPPNLLRIGPHLAGHDRRLAAAPSLSWLRASRRTPFRGDGRISAWIPDAQPDEGLPTLAILADRLADTFAVHGVTLSSGFEPPATLKGSDMMIVAAHGGVAEDKRYFRVVTDDVDLALASSTISGSLEGIGVVVLFVCSGGRLDKHPGASATVGLVRRLLDNGCRAVVAPPWPLRTNVPPYWLPTFLDRWSASAAVIDACFDANCAVRAALGDDPATDLAMTVYGDPLTSRSAKLDR
jgi:hypothetical protein